MFESLLEEVNRLYPNKGILTLEDVCTFLECEAQTVYNWGKRSDPKKRPPRIIVGKSIRFSKTEFVKWLAGESTWGKI